MHSVQCVVQCSYSTVTLSEAWLTGSLNTLLHVLQKGVEGAGGSTATEARDPTPWTVTVYGSNAMDASAATTRLSERNMQCHQHHYHQRVDTGGSTLDTNLAFPLPLVQSSMDTEGNCGEADEHAGSAVSGIPASWEMPMMSMSPTRER